MTGAGFVFVTFATFGTLGTLLGYGYGKAFVDAICLLFGFKFDPIFRLSLLVGILIADGLPFNNGFLIAFP